MAYWHHWLRDNIYVTLCLATFLEGLGLPVPGELFFVVAAALIHQGDATLPAVILAATLGNVAGSLLAFSLAYAGGAALMRRAARLMRISDRAVDRVEEFFVRYGTATVFLSRFVGVIRAATIYMSGAARMDPLRFTAYLTAGALLWNGLWATVAYRFGRAFPALMHRVMGRGMIGFLLLGASVVLFVIALRKRRGPVGN